MWGVGGERRRIPPLFFLSFCVRPRPSLLVRTATISDLVGRESSEKDPRSLKLLYDSMEKIAIYLLLCNTYVYVPRFGLVSIKIRPIQTIKWSESQ